jgi:hypothetical protein
MDMENKMLSLSLSRKTKQNAFVFSIPQLLYISGQPSISRNHHALEPLELQLSLLGFLFCFFKKYLEGKNDKSFCACASAWIPTFLKKKKKK